MNSDHSIDLLRIRTDRSMHPMRLRLETNKVIRPVLVHGIYTVLILRFAVDVTRSSMSSTHTEFEVVDWPNCQVRANMHRQLRKRMAVNDF